MVAAEEEGHAADAERGEGKEKEQDKDKEPAPNDAKDAAEKGSDGAAVGATGTLAIVPVDTPANGTAEGTTAKEDAATPKGIIFTLGHPAEWDLKGFFLVLKTQKIQNVLDARQPQESELTPEAVRVACTAFGINYERQPLLSNAYINLVTQASGKKGDTCSPCVLLSGATSWRLQQQRRCISRYMKTKKLEVRHLMWDGGGIDTEAAAQCEKEPNRADYTYPKAPPAPPPGARRPSQPDTRPPTMRRWPKASSAGGTAEPAGASTGASAKAPLMQSRAKGGSPVVQQEVAQTKDKPKPKESIAGILAPKAKPKDQAKPKESTAGTIAPKAQPKESIAGTIAPKAKPKDQAKPKESTAGILAPKAQSKPKESIAGIIAPKKAATEGQTAPAADGKEVLRAKPKSGGSAQAEAKSTAGKDSAEASKSFKGMRPSDLLARARAASAQGSAAQPDAEASPAAPKAGHEKPTAAKDAKEDEGPSKKAKTEPDPSPAAASKPSGIQDDLWGLLLSKPSASAPGTATEPRAESVKAGGKATAEAPVKAQGSAQTTSSSSSSGAPKDEPEPSPNTILKARAKGGASAPKATPTVDQPAKAKAAPAGSAALQAGAKA
eukprot:CAMPEP_0171257430 /NCGR_PEP_ID=MMETSP0790-20130122/53843_1 /TAXON_ID=2925 /ORGANISM="Alexandrium catenella, Strain OF101" /LENGTH=608 /DNA_ID=CAMNT_0011725543 /DNA_START=217 /DNA_END=2040 /DNA_ORIENTATION=+